MIIGIMGESIATELESYCIKPYDVMNHFLTITQTISQLYLPILQNPVQVEYSTMYLLGRQDLVSQQTLSNVQESDIEHGGKSTITYRIAFLLTSYDGFILGERELGFGQDMHSTHYPEINTQKKVLSSQRGYKGGPFMTCMHINTFFQFLMIMNIMIKPQVKS